VNLTEFFIKLAVNADTTTLKDFVSMVGDLSLGSATAVGALGELQSKFTEVFKSSMGAAMGLKEFNAITGLNTDQLQKWQIAGEQAGVSFDTTKTSIMNLQKFLNEMQRSGQGGNILKALGVAETYDPYQMLRNLSDALVKGKNRGQIMDFITKTGVAPEMALMMQKGSGFVNKAGGFVPGFNEHDLKNFEDAHLFFSKFGLAFRQLGIDASSMAVDIATFQAGFRNFLKFDWAMVNPGTALLLGVTGAAGKAGVSSVIANITIHGVEKAGEIADAVSKALADGIRLADQQTNNAEKH
jgi:hypothetical protein